MPTARDVVTVTLDQEMAQPEGQGQRDDHGQDREVHLQTECARGGRHRDGSAAG
jgi:hypothetical protein